MSPEAPMLWMGTLSACELRPETLFLLNTPGYSSSSESCPSNRADSAVGERSVIAWIS